MKKFWIIFSIFFLIGIYVSGKATIQIILPKGAQHNTIGELPIVEMADDGNFYEKDGAEEAERKLKIEILQDKIENRYLDCLKANIDKKANCGYIEGDNKNSCKAERYSNCEKQYIKAMKKSFKEFSPWTSLMKFFDENYDNGFQKGYWNRFLKGYELK